MLQSSSLSSPGPGSGGGVRGRWHELLSQGAFGTASLLRVQQNLGPSVAAVGPVDHDGWRI